MKIKPDGRKETVKGCECEWCTHKRRLQSRNHKLRELGKPQLVSKAEYENARRKLRIFKARGMSCVMMARATGLSDSTIAQIVAGQRFHRSEPVGTVRRDTLNAIMRMEFEEPTEDGKYAGARLDPHGTRRRMQALHAIGFGFDFLGAEMGKTKSHPARVANPNHRLDFVTYQTYRQVKRLYEKYRYVNPLDVGVSEYCYHRALKEAAKKGYAPPSAWDDDLIDDPEAYPEWTGLCGTMQGVRLHRKHGPLTSVCKPCTEARARERAEKGNDAA